MTNLETQQRLFAASLRDPDNNMILNEMAGVSGEMLPSKPRFDVYRNNVFSSLTDALAALYPVCQRLVGQTFFRAMARAYLQRPAPDALPRQASLIGFAPDFAGFLVSFEPARGVPYLPDVARLEYAWHRVYHAADATPVTAQDLQVVLEREGAQALDGLRLALPAAHSLLMAPYAVSRIWEANQPANDGKLDVTTGDVAERLFVVRPGAQVEVRRLSPGAFSFVCAVDGGVTLGRAMISAFEAEPDADPQLIFAALLTAGSFVWPTGAAA